ncbi:ABC transporter substrate-binding protein [Paracoccus aestuariivivens]|uniref:Extracellular solute-binding protein n=1 Tax=Paracoccus aestuariivivens TaxID=1820333 RepID=A0A6L6JCL8_9RHOB|nr:extracellular solute-binding protein [Paracoccus aestuariivivens]MTH78469.1 extracellular solute-binding protein [Paracoccus aestuariivivens]
MKAILGAAALCAFAAVAAHAETSVKLLRPESNSPGLKQFYADVIAEYEAAHPDVDVEIEFFASEAYKTKLPTMLQSDARPDLIYSWAGLTLADQVKAGLVQDISGSLDKEYLDSFTPGARAAFSNGDAVYGLPMEARLVVFFANQELTDKAGLDLAAIKTWDDFLAAVGKLKGAGITPLVSGGKDKWPLHFYYSYLALREGGPQGIRAAMDDDGDGFNSAAFVGAGERFKQLVDLDPFQPGVLSTAADQGNTMFAEGKGAFMLMGDWAYTQTIGVEQGNLLDGSLKILPFPALGASGGDDAATLGGVNGFAVTTGAPPEALDFLKFLVNAEHQREGARRALFVPVIAGTGDAIEVPFTQEINAMLEASPSHQIFLDQFLGASVGGTINDISADLVSGDVTPTEAAERIQEAWEFR